MPPLTLHHIARLAGVSRSTVSRVINNHPNVSDDVRERVQKIIDETGYLPNVAARSLRSKRSNIIGLVIPESVHTLFTDPYFPRLTQGVAQACNRHNKTLALFIESDTQSLFPRVSHRGQLDGVLLQTGRIGNELITRLLEAKMPMVVLGRPSSQDASYINVDNVAGAYIATIHLTGLGYQRIATITGGLDNTTGVDRLAGYKRALTERGYVLDEDLIVQGDFTELGGYYAAQKLLKYHPDAIFAASDTMARGAIRFFRENDISVPEDIGIVGYDDLPPAIDTKPLLTTVRQPIRRFGVKAVETLLDVIEYGPEPLRRIQMDVELVIRDSCGVKLRERA